MSRSDGEQHARPVVRIGERTIGPGQPAYLIAEAGVNHDGSLERGLRLVDIACRAGADAVKFQVFRAAELTTAAAPLAAYQQQANLGSQRELLSRLELSDADFAQLAAHCARRRVEFLATPFSPADVERLVALKVRAIKIASTDLNNTPLLEAAARTGLPLIVSTGAALPGEIEQAVTRLRGWGAGGRLILLHCVSGYPTPLEAANLRAVSTLSGRFAVPTGFSDHTTSTRTGGWAVAAGACVLEKHFTLDRTRPGPDHAMSLDPAGLREYVRHVRAAERALGSGMLGMSALEADVRQAARKSVVTTRALAGGTILERGMLTAKRPAGGIAPDQLEALLGRQLACDVPADAMLTWDMLR